MEVVLIRHANSMANARLTDDLNSELTPLGEKQAKVTAEFLADYLSEGSFEWFEQGEIWTSPYKRTLKTSWVISESLGLPVFQDWRLRELIAEQGHYTPDSFPLYVNPYRLWSLYELESEQETIDRLNDFVESYSGKLIIVSHGIPTRILKSLYLEYYNDGYKMTELPEWDGSVKNCSVTHIKNGKLLLDKYTGHLEEEGVVTPHS